MIVVDNFKSISETDNYIKHINPQYLDPPDTVFCKT